MGAQNRSRPEKLASPLAVAGLLSGLLGFVVLIGWYTHSVMLVQVLPSFVPMQYNTALGFFLSGMALLATARQWRRLAIGATGIVVAIGGLTLIEYITGVNLAIDELLMDHYVQVKTSHPGRMAPNTALCFLLTGIAMALLLRGAGIALLRASGTVGALTTGLGLVALLGYASGLETTYGWGHLTRMAVHTSVGFVVLGMGLVVHCRTELQRLDPEGMWPVVLAGVGSFTMAVVLWQALTAQAHLSAVTSDLVLVVCLAIAALVTGLMHSVQRARALQRELLAANAGLDQTINERTSTLQAEIEVRQQRELEQRALAAVRDTVWALSSSADIEKVMPAVGQALKDAAVPFTNSGINLVEGTDPSRMTVAMFNDVGELVLEQLEDSDNVVLRFWQEQTLAYRRDLNVDDPYGERAFIRPPTCCIVDVPFSHGTLAVASPQPSAFDGHLEFLQQLAGVLSEGYRRADDLHLLEERSRHLQREEHRQRRILETANEGFWRVDVEGVTIEVNDASCRITARSREELIGHSLFEFLDDESTNFVRRHMDTQRDQTETAAYEVAFMRPDGSQLPCLVSDTPLYDEEGVNIGSFAMITDISERKRQQQRDALVTRLRENVWRLDSDAGLMDLVRPLPQVFDDLGLPYRAFGLNIVDATQDPPTACVHGINVTGTWTQNEIPAEHADLVVRFWRAGEIVHRPDLQADDPLGELALWPGSVTPPRSIIDFPFSHGTIAFSSDVAHGFEPFMHLLQQMIEVMSEGFHRLDDLQALHDRTEHAEAAQRMAEAANRSKSIFLTNMSHEIRTPMNAILGFTEILHTTLTDSRQKDYDPRLGDYVESIQASGKTLLALINDILDLSKVESGQLDLEYRPADAHAVLRDLERLFGKQVEDKGLSLQVEIDDSLPGVLVIDEIRLRQVLVNLVSNAVKFTKVGQIRVSATATTTGDEQVTVRIEVADTGIGIPADQHDRIFGTFEQSEGQSINEYGGTGLGLAITRQLVELMNGEVSLSSRLGEGSVFSVELRHVTVADTGQLTHARPEGVQVEDYQFKSATVLVADDVPANRNLVKGFLADYPFQIIDADNGEQAIEMIQRWRPDLVLMDIKMPILDGFSAAKRLKANDEMADIPIVALTASVMKESEAEIGQVCDGFLRKPVSRDELVLEIARFLPHEIRASGAVIAQEGRSEWSVADMTVSQRSRLPKLLGDLEHRRDLWETLKATLTINEVEDFATDLQRLGDEYDYPPLELWGQRVNHQATTFDMDELAVSMAAYPELLDDLGAVVSA